MMVLKFIWEGVMKIFRTKVAIVSDEVAEQQIKFEDMGIETTIDDSEIGYKSIAIRYKHIICSEEDEHNGGFMVTLKNGNEIYCVDDPFSEDRICQ